MSAEPWREKSAVHDALNVALTFRGVTRLGWGEWFDESRFEAFRQGMLERSSRLLQRAREIAAKRGVSVESEPVAENRSVPCSPRLASLFTQAVQELGHPAVTLGSGAGHDAVVMAGITDVAMLFVRCKGGISHNPAESVTEEDVAVAIDVLGKFLELLATKS